MTVSRSAVALRTLVRDTLSSAPFGESLTNINTRVLPDGAACFVIEDRSLWRLNKASTAGANPGIVVVPAAGPGRWLKESSLANASTLWVTGLAQNSTDSSASASWLEPQTSAFGFPLGNPSPFTLTTLGCILTYNGPTAARFLFTLAVSLNFAVSGDIFAGISLNDDLTGVVDGFAEGTQFMDTEDGAVEDIQITCQRMVILSPTDTIRPKFRAPTDTDLLINRLTLTAIAV